jgi:hypothetical protein
MDYYEQAEAEEPRGGDQQHRTVSDVLDEAHEVQQETRSATAGREQRSTQLRVTEKNYALSSSDLVMKLHHAALVGFDLRQMEGDVSVELFEEPYPIADQDRQDRITNFVGKPETKAFAGNDAASNKPDGTERRPQAPIYELREIT